MSSVCHHIPIHHDQLQGGFTVSFDMNAGYRGMVGRILSGEYDATNELASDTSLPPAAVPRRRKGLRGRAARGGVILSSS